MEDYDTVGILTRIERIMYDAELCHLADNLPGIRKYINDGWEVLGSVDEQYRDCEDYRKALDLLNEKRDSLLGTGF